jgi:ABC-type Zn uptake system ZnuABC Zn-binding protein ZnuA
VEVSQGVPLRSIIELESGNKPVDDPHTWMDPNNVMIWVDNITKALSEKDPQNADYYQANGQAYKGRLVELDNQIRSEVAAVPKQNRKIVTEHMVFGYYAEQYGFSQVGAIIPGFSSLAEPSAQDIAHIEDSIKTLGVKAIFLSIGVNENIARRIAEDTGTRLALLYMESLSDKKGPAGNYLDFMQFDVLSMVDALK